ncbi:hypothetical protein GF376_04340 [Candidatus Peregrinibacteria bacterium]|nr:hypothetical protein [Candidatus Peregrinibacteria bacterium]
MNPPRSHQEKQPKAATNSPKMVEDKPSLKKFKEKLGEIHEEQKKRLREKASESFLRGSIGQKNWEQLFDKGENRLMELKNKYFNQRQTLLDQKKALRESLILDNAETEMEEFTNIFRGIIDHFRNKGEITEVELVRVEAMFNAMKQMESSPEIQDLFMKILSDKPLAKEDFRKLISFIKPIDIKSENDPKKLFEGAETGALISALQPAERIELIKMLYQIKSPSEATGILESMIHHSMLSNDQIDYLIKSEIIPREKALMIKQKKENGTYQKIQEKYLEFLCELQNSQKGKTAYNNLDKVVSKKGLVAVAGIWGAATALINFGVNFDLNKPFSSSVDALKSPWFLIGTGTTLASIATLAPAAAPETTKKATDWVKEFFSGPEYKQKLREKERQELQAYMLEPMKKNPRFTELILKKSNKGKSVYEVLLEMRQEIQNKKLSEISLEELEKRLDSSQRIALNEALSTTYGQDKRAALELQLKSYVWIGEGLGLDNHSKIENFINEYQHSQGIK